MARSLFDILEEKVDPNLLNAAYRAYAKAMAEAQALEEMLSLFLLEASFERSPHQDIEEFARITRFDLDKRTLGKLLKSIKTKIRPLPKDFRKTLNRHSIFAIFSHMSSS
jgi:hypothetical protein